jgi:ATP-dependent exoDNAse (exonuclease V) beta subunit
MTKPLADAAERELIRTALDTTLVVEAAAGTGKTTEIVNRIAAVLAEGRATARSLVAVTFTGKAAGELKLRLRAALEGQRRTEQDAKRRANVEDALARLEEARVSTIHAFCNDLLAERPVEAIVDTDFRLMDEAASDLMFRDVFTRWFQRELENTSEGLRRVLRRQGQGSIMEQLFAGARELAEWREYLAPWRRDPFDREAAVDETVESVRELAEATLKPAWNRDYLFLDTEPARDLIADIDRSEIDRPRDYDAIEGALVALANNSAFQKAGPGRGDGYSRTHPRAAVIAQHQATVNALEEFAERANADLAPLLQRELMNAVAEFEKAKRAAGTIDYSDQVLRVRNLVRDRPDVRREFQERFTHIFVDEFQDTNLVQAELLMLLAAGDPTISAWRDVTVKPGKLFIVGDPKQSIYRFRRADVHVYEAVKQQLERGGAECLYLRTSFRSVPTIQRVVNAAFAPRMTGAHAGETRYVPLAPYRSDVATQPAVVVLPVPKPYGQRDHTQGAIRRSLPDAVAAFLHWLLKESGWTVEENGARVPVKAQHVCILFKQYTATEYTPFGTRPMDLTRAYIDALEARDIPHLLVRGRSLHAREEVMTIRAALTAVEYPDDELSLYATLRGTLFAIRDADLFEYRESHKRLHFFRIPEDVEPHLQPIIDALTFLKELHLLRNYRPIAETLALLLDHTRAHAAFVLRPNGDQVLANVLLLGELARAYDSSAALSFRGFVDQMAIDAERATKTEAPTLEEGSEGIKLMTVHSAKGLEFPVVVLADPCAKLTPRYVSRHIDSARGLCAFPLADCTPVEIVENRTRELEDDTAENVRTAYVAATRAQDLLVIPATADKPFDGWLAPFSPAIYPDEERRGTPAHSPGCPPFGNDTVLERPDAARVQRIVPGLHQLLDRDGQFGVVWWDPSTLSLGVRPRFGLRQERLLSKDVDTNTLASDVERFRRWESERAARLSRAAAPSIQVQRATDAGGIPDEPTPVLFVELPEIPNRPIGPRFGTLVHNILATIPLDSANDLVQIASEAEGRIVAASEEEVRAATETVIAALQHPLLRRAHIAEKRGALRREVPVALSPQSGMVIEGIVDLAFEEQDEWIVIDFKTDHDLERGRERYENQLAWYSAAVREATNRPNHAILFHV